MQKDTRADGHQEERQPAAPAGGARARKKPGPRPGKKRDTQCGARWQGDDWLARAREDLAGLYGDGAHIIREHDGGAWKDGKKPGAGGAPDEEALVKKTTKTRAAAPIAAPARAHKGGRGKGIDWDAPENLKRLKTESVKVLAEAFGVSEQAVYHARKVRGIENPKAPVIVTAGPGRTAAQKLDELVGHVATPAVVERAGALALEAQAESAVLHEFFDAPPRHVEAVAESDGIDPSGKIVIRVRTPEEREAFRLQREAERRCDGAGLALDECRAEKSKTMVGCPRCDQRIRRSAVAKGGVPEHQRVGQRRAPPARVTIDQPVDDELLAACGEGRLTPAEDVALVERLTGEGRAALRDLFSREVPAPPGERAVMVIDQDAPVLGGSQGRPVAGPCPASLSGGPHLVIENPDNMNAGDGVCEACGATGLLYCRHPHIVPNPDTPGDGLCEACGETGFPMTDDFAWLCSGCGTFDPDCGCTDPDCDCTPRAPCDVRDVDHRVLTIFFESSREVELLDELVATGIYGDTRGSVAQAVLVERLRAIALAKR